VILRPICETSPQPLSRPGSGLGGAAISARRRDARSTVEQRLTCERPRHFRYLLARLPSREDAEDVLQDFTIKALQGAGCVREEKMDAWLNVSLRNALFDRYRRAGARRRLSDAAAAEPTECVEPEVVDEMSINCLAMSVAELKPSYATMLRRADLDEVPLGDLACELGLTSNNTAVRLHRAREGLRRTMHARCSACPTPCLLAAHFIARAPPGANFVPPPLSRSGDAKRQRAWPSVANSTTDDQLEQA
jgi:RNA polymerase sigma-70 factor (ECF subfamily)